jgi:hypothetical protein
MSEQAKTPKIIIEEIQTRKSGKPPTPQWIVIRSPKTGAVAAVSL